MSPRRDPQRALTRRSAIALTCGATASWSVVMAALVALTRASATAVGAPGPARADDAIALICGSAALALAVWLALAVLLSAHSAYTGAGRAAAARVAPVGLRRTVAAVVGAIVVGMALPSTASAATVLDPGRDLSPAWVDTTSSAPLAGGPTRPSPSAVAQAVEARDSATKAERSLDPAWAPTPAAAPTAAIAAPDRPPRPQVVLPGTAVRPSIGAQTQVAVRSGDTLWRVAERHLGQTATASEIADEWPRWWQANRAVIGDDPDVLHPGQLLTPPPPP